MKKLIVTLFFAAALSAAPATNSIGDAFDQAESAYKAQLDSLRQDSIKFAYENDSLKRGPVCGTGTENLTVLEYAAKKALADL